jgi:hypothetical protein
VLLLVMAWSPPALSAGIVWVSAPGDYATFNSNHTPHGTPWRSGYPDKATASITAARKSMTATSIPTVAPE